MTRWRPGEAEIEQLLADHALQLVTGTVADGRPALERAGHTLVSAQSLLDTDPINAFVLAYDAVRQACTALLTHQGLRPTSSGGHVAVERAVRAQFGAPFAPYGGLRRRRNEVEYPSHPDEHVDAEEASQAINIAKSLIESAEKLLHTSSSSPPDQSHGTAHEQVLVQANELPTSAPDRATATRRLDVSQARVGEHEPIKDDHEPVPPASSDEEPHRSTSGAQVTASYELGVESDS